jgi:hypothetical protein
LIRDAVAKQCGDSTGLVTDPAACTFKPASLICKARQNSECLSAAEAEVLDKWYAGPKNSRGEQLYPGRLPKGSEPYWPLWLTGLEPAGGRLIDAFGLDFLRYMAFQDDPGERYRASDFDFDKDPPRLAFMAAIYNAMGTDLSRFKARGGKLLLYQGRGYGCHTSEHARLLLRCREGAWRQCCRLLSPLHDPRHGSLRIARADREIRPPYTPNHHRAGPDIGVMMPGLTKRMTLEAWRHSNVSNEDLLEAIDKVGNAAAAVRKELQGKGLAMPDNDKPLKPEDFPVNAEGKKIKIEDGTPIAETPDPAVATDVANRLNGEESAARRRQVVGLRSCGGCHVEALLPRIVLITSSNMTLKSRPALPVCGAVV